MRVPSALRSPLALDLNCSLVLATREVYSFDLGVTRRSGSFDADEAYIWIRPMSTSPDDGWSLNGQNKSISFARIAGNVGQK